MLSVAFCAVHRGSSSPSVFFCLGTPSSVIEHLTVIQITLSVVFRISTMILWERISMFS